MKILSVVNNKGGVGKTTSTQNIGAALAKFAKAKVLFIDLDSQASLTRCFGITESEVGRSTAGSFLTGETTFEATVKKVNCGYLLPSSNDLNVKEDQLKASPLFPFNCKIALEKLNEKFDYIILDCPPTLGSFTRLALIACDYYLVPLQAEFLSYEGLRNFLLYSAEIKQISPNSQLGGVFATRYNPNNRKKLSNDIIEATKNQLKEKFFDTYIRDNISISEAQARGTDIFNHSSESNGAIDYYNLTKEILKLN